MTTFDKAINEEYRIDINISGCPVLRKFTPFGWQGVAIAEKDEDGWTVTNIDDDITVGLGLVSEDEAIAYMWDNRSDGGQEIQTIVHEDKP
jgi:hypothetical protein